MFSFSDILPFSSSQFFWFYFASVALMYLSKYLLKEKLSYRTVLAIISGSYLLFLFPQPIQFFGLILYLYLFYYLFTFRWKTSKLALPMLVFSLPLLCMKWINRTEGEELMWLDLGKLIFQVAGLSYVTFKVISLYLDERESTQKVSFLNYFNYAGFTPTLLIGPLDRYARFQKDIDSGYGNLNAENREKGFDLLLKGLLYKFIIAEFINRLILLELTNDGSGFYHVTYMFSYLFYLFFDFAGYSLLAMSFGYFLGIKVPFNFDKPFLSENPKMLWQRWHKTLGDWLNDYFFKPIFKNLTERQVLKPIQRQNIALFLTFTLMGFWNGLELHYILSGMLFGLYSVIHNYYSYRCKKDKHDVLFGSMNTQVVRWISIALMLVSTAFAIYIFSGNLI